MDNPKIFYQKTAQKNLLESQKLKKQDRLIAAIRITYFILSISLIIYFANAREVLSLSIYLVFFVISFALLIKKHNILSYKLKLTNYLVEINNKEQKILEGAFKDISPDGSEFKDSKHSYSADLDIFGKNSLFQFVNRTATIIGQNTLAKWLLNKSSIEEILLRQEAVKELANKSDWRQEFQARGMFAKANQSDIDLFKKWFDKKPFVFSNKIYGVLPIILSITALSSILGFLFFSTPLSFIIIALAINFSVLGRTAKKITALSDETVKHLETLKAFSNLIKMVEQEDFSSSKLNKLKKHFKSDNLLASKEINRLTKILTNLEARQNAFFFITINIIFLHEIIWTWKLEKWKTEKKDTLLSWFETISEVEALNSFASLSYSFPEFCYPEISKNPYIFETTNLGHPLIHKNKRVNNNFELNGKGQITIITGSNMSGKSTFLRTLGINAVLAFAGAPVCASEMKISCFSIFTGMRIEDSLEENVSAFYAELQRIKMLFDKIENKEQVFFMLDEILKGTNSKDRHNGVYNIVKRLIAKTAFGLISTHDLELADLEKDYESVSNKSFGSSIINEELKFHYTINSGVCDSFSATQLMKNIGIIEN